MERDRYREIETEISEKGLRMKEQKQDVILFLSYIIILHMFTYSMSNLRLERERERYS